MSSHMVEKIKRFIWPRQNNEIVVMGHQKSGTTVIGELISAYSGLSYSNDPLYRIDLGSGSVAKNLVCGDLKLKQVINKKRKLFGAQVIKDPDFIFIVDEVLEEYEGSRFVYIVRDPRDNIRSILNRLDLAPNSNIESPINAHWNMILNGLLPEVENHSNSSIIENLSRRWVLANKHYMRKNSHVLLVRYEDFLADKEECINGIANDLCLKKKFDISEMLDYQFQPKGDCNIDIESYFGKANIEIILDICGDTMVQFGYL